MNITITSKANIRDTFKERAEKKLSKLDKFFDKEAQASVKVSFKKDLETVEVTIRSQGLIFRSERTTDDKFNSLDAVVDALTKQIVRNKGKLEARIKAPSFDVLDFTDDFSEEHEVVKIKEFVVSPMEIDEAILQMNMLGHHFFLFRNVDSGEINLLYKRNDGEYGVIVPIEN